VKITSDPVKRDPYFCRKVIPSVTRRSLSLECIVSTSTGPGVLDAKMLASLFWLKTSAFTAPGAKTKAIAAALIVDLFINRLLTRNGIILNEAMIKRPTNEILGRFFQHYVKIISAHLVQHF
jgi:hypothetical protein